MTREETLKAFCGMTNNAGLNNRAGKEYSWSLNELLDVLAAAGVFREEHGPSEPDDQTDPQGDRFDTDQIKAEALAYRTADTAARRLGAKRGFVIDFIGKQGAEIAEITAAASKAGWGSGETIAAFIARGANALNDQADEISALNSSGAVRIKQTATLLDQNRAATGAGKPESTTTAAFILAQARDLADAKDDIVRLTKMLAVVMGERRAAEDRIAEANKENEDLRRALRDK
ncbi:MAG TPA: hypothetical protein ENH33_07280 [Actinobacteria bacterium]|nr:hypothetical protein [Actinomycetota bacterium]